MTVSKHTVLLFLCIVFLFALALRSSIKSYIPYAHIEGYEERSYTLDIGSLADQIQSDYQKHMLDRKTVYGQSQGLDQTSQNQTNSVTSRNAFISSSEDPFVNCQGLYRCAPIASNDINSLSRIGTNNAGVLSASNKKVDSKNSMSTLNDNSKGSGLSNKQMSCSCPPQLSMDDLLSLDLWSAEEKSVERAMNDAQNIREAAIATVKDYQDKLRDSMMDGVAKANAITNASNMLESTIQNQAISGNMPGAMMDGITAATQPITDKINELSDTVEKMKTTVDKARQRVNRIRFAF